MNIRIRSWLTHLTTTRFRPAWQCNTRRDAMVYVPFGKGMHYCTKEIVELYFLRRLINPLLVNLIIPSINPF